MKTRADYERVLLLIGDVIKSWDPYGLLAGGAPSDEFDAEIARIATQVPAIASAEDAAVAVSLVFSDAFDPGDFHLESCREVGRQLVQRLTEEGYLEAAR